LWALINLTCPKDIEYSPHYDIFITDEFIERFFQLIQSQYADIHENTIWLMTHLVTDSFKFRDKVIPSKIFGEVLKVLRKDQGALEVVRQNMRFLNNIFKNSKNTPPKKSLLEAMVIFANYIYSEDPEILCNCIWGLYYISQFDQDNPNIHKDIIDSGAIVKVMKINFSKYNLCISPSIRLFGNLLTGTAEIVDVKFFRKLKYFYKNFLDSH
jgi:importin subunit alpha-6/7